MGGNGRAARRRAVIIGGSVGGLFAGNFLLRQGWDVDIYERASEGLASRGLGIAAHDELETLISAAGAAMPQPLGIEVRGRSAFDRTGRLIANFDFPQHLAAWTGVFNSLHAAFPKGRYHNGWELVGVDAGKTGSHARFANGNSVEADLIVGADGFRSTVRAVVAPGVNPRYAGYVAWRGVVEESALSAEFRAETINQFAFVFPRASEFIGYPVPGDDGSADLGRRRYNFLWYYPVSPGPALDDVLTDDQGRLHEYSIAPPLIRAEHIEKLKQSARELLPAKFLEVFGAAKRYMVQPIYDVESERIGFDDIALIGDAGFVARPHVGVGVLKAGRDALELTKCLSSTPSVSAALELYQRTRIDDGRKSVAAGRRLGAFIERGHDGPWTDPALQLSVQDIIRVSGRPVGQSEAEVRHSDRPGDAIAIRPNQQ